MFRATVTKNDMILEGDELITSGSVKTNFVTFTFDAVWEGIVKTAVFRTKKVQIPVIIDEGSLRVAIPWEAMAFPKETIELGVYGVRPDDTETEEIDEEIVIPTIWKTLGKVVEGTTVIVPPPTAPTKDSYKQLLEYILALKPGGGEGGSGFSPTVSVEEAEDGSGFKVTIIDVNGPKEFFIHNGSDGKDGIDGENGKDGIDGKDGTSPTFSITEFENGYRLTLTDVNGEQSIDILNGLDGVDGNDGVNGSDGKDGEDGATFTPSVSEEGDLSWTNDRGLPNPPTVNIKGPPGEGGSGGVDFEIDDTLIMDIDNVLGVKTPVRGILTRDEYEALSEEEKNLGFYIIDEPGESSGGGSIGGSGLPKGVIVMWTGDVAPKGWAICNGENGTPDLRDRFIVGSGQTYSNGDIGGEAEVILESQHMPRHRHDITFNNGKYSSSGTATGVTSIPMTNAYSAYTSYVGNSQPHNNLPPYYALAFIMKISDDSSGGSSSGSSDGPSNHIYSTEEHIVGTWIDGRPVYEMTIRSKTPNAPLSNETYSYVNVLSSIENFDILISCEGTYNPSNIWKNFPSIYQTVGSMYITCSVDGRIDIRFDKTGTGAIGTENFGAIAYITLKYTKISDSPEVTS